MAMKKRATTADDGESRAARAKRKEERRSLRYDEMQGASEPLSPDEEKRAARRRASIEQKDSRRKMSEQKKEIKREKKTEKREMRRRDSERKVALEARRGDKYDNY
jgi:hypothetical protein